MNFWDYFFYHNHVQWIGAIKHRNHIKIYCAQPMQVKLNFSNPSGEAKNFLFILCITFILKTQIYSLKDAIGREMVVYVDTKKKWKILQITNFIANWNFMFWHDWKLHKTLWFYSIIEFYRSHRSSDERRFFIHHHHVWWVKIIQINFWSLSCKRIKEKKLQLWQIMKNKHKNW